MRAAASTDVDVPVACAHDCRAPNVAAATRAPERDMKSRAATEGRGDRKRTGEGPGSARPPEAEALRMGQRSTGWTRRSCMEGRGVTSLPTASHHRNTALPDLSAVV